MQSENTELELLKHMNKSHFKAGKILEHVSSRRILKLQNWSTVSSRGLISIREAFVDVLWWNPAGFPDLIAR